MEKFKLKFGNVKYQVDEVKKVVVARLKTYWNGTNGYYNPIHTIGVARCAKDDTFNIKKGKQLARARAEKEAYIQYQNILYSLKKRTDDYSASLRYTINCMKDYIQHQKDYIKQF